MERLHGYSLLELLTALVVAGVILSIAAPPMRRLVVTMRVQGAARVVRADLEYARMEGKRGGRGAVVTFLRDPGCAWAGARGGRAYRIAPRVAPGAPRPETLRTLDDGVCYDVNNSDSLVFDSHGLLAPFSNRTIWTAADDVRAAVTVSVAGRVRIRPQ
jgi:prepilin-type N-terminal cleavage/methylation domain-containing protein